MTSIRLSQHASVALVLTVGLLCGCQCGPRDDRNLHADSANSQPAVIHDALYTGNPPGGANARTEVVVNGSYFKSSDVTVDDCMTRLPNHPVPSQREWKSCRELLGQPSGISYYIRVEHSAAHDEVQIRVRGADGGWSAPFVIRKD